MTRLTPERFEEIMTRVEQRISTHTDAVALAEHILVQNQDLTEAIAALRDARDPDLTEYEIMEKTQGHLKTALERAIGEAVAKEREACARIAEAQPFYHDTHTGMRQQWVKEQIAAAIRARGEGGDGPPCAVRLWNAGKASPKSCERCGLGPCEYGEVRKS